MLTLFFQVRIGILARVPEFKRRKQVEFMSRESIVFFRLCRIPRGEQASHLDAYEDKRSMMKEAQIILPRIRKRGRPPNEIKMNRAGESSSPSERVSEISKKSRYLVEEKPVIKAPSKTGTDELTKDNQNIANKIQKSSAAAPCANLRTLETVIETMGIDVPSNRYLLAYNRVGKVKHYLLSVI